MIRNSKRIENEIPFKSWILQTDERREKRPRSEINVNEKREENSAWKKWYEEQEKKVRKA